MEEVLLGSMSNTVSISSSGCRVEDKRGSHRIEVSVLCPLPPHIQRSLDPTPGPLAPLDLLVVQPATQLAERGGL